jgi:hypothetical protein
LRRVGFAISASFRKIRKILSFLKVPQKTEEHRNGSLQVGFQKSKKQPKLSALFFPKVECGQYDIRSPYLL